MNLQDLHKPFPANEIEWRVGSTSNDKSKGLALAYLTARHIMERLDDVCGPANWSDRYEFHGTRTVCYLSIRIGDEWVTKADGAGDSDVEAEKGAISDALKRAAVKWGIGRYLYSMENIWVQIEQAGRSYKIKDSEHAKLEQALRRQFGAEPASPAQTTKREAIITSYEGHTRAIAGAETMDALQAAFLSAKSDKGLTSEQASDLIAAKDRRKAELTKPEVPPDFDHLQTGERHPGDYLRA